jgi:hypothetical protein
LSNHSKSATSNECCEYVVIRVQSNEDKTFHILTLLSEEHVAT